MKQPMRVLTSNDTNEWYTPPHIVDRAREVMGGIDLDPASNATAQHWIGATTYYDGALWSGLALPWYGRVWLNPPFSDTPEWVARWLTDRNMTEGMLLVNSAPGYAWWESLWRAVPVVLLRERLRFVAPDGAVGGQAKKGQTIAYRGPNAGRFAECFADLGRVVLP
jgi:hypothetical protein